MSSKKRVLLLTYYWPNAGGAGVQRWLKMSKYIAQETELTVYHPSNADYPITDSSLKAEIPNNIKTISSSILEPYQLASFVNSKNNQYQKGHIDSKENQTLLSKLSLWIRANYFIPDARVWWVSKSVKILKKHLQNHPQDVVITTGPPHSMHLIAYELKQFFPNLTWIADFRDPWTAIDYIEKLPLTEKSIKKNQDLEKKVLQTADFVTTVSPSWAEDLQKISQRKIEVIFNGFDEDDFNDNTIPDSHFSFTYTGSLNIDRNPKLLWNVLNELCQIPEFYQTLQLNLIGNISDEVIKDINQYNLLKDKLIIKEYLPHNQSIIELQKSQILLLLINETTNEKGIIPGKLFEYMAAKRRILCIGNSDSDIAEILEKTQAGKVVNRQDQVTMKNQIWNWFEEFKQKKSLIVTDSDIAQYSRKNSALDFINLIKNK